MYVWLLVPMSVCMYGYQWLCMATYVYVWLCMAMYVCLYVCMYGCMYVCMHGSLYVRACVYVQSRIVHLSYCLKLATILEISVCKHAEVFRCLKAKNIAIFTLLVFLAPCLLWIFLCPRRNNWLKICSWSWKFLTERELNPHLLSRKGRVSWESIKSMIKDGCTFASNGTLLVQNHAETCLSRMIIWIMLQVIPNQTELKNKNPSMFLQSHESDGELQYSVSLSSLLDSSIVVKPNKGFS